LTNTKIKDSWGDKFQYHIQKWNQRHKLALYGVRYNHDVYPNCQYFEWYWNFFGYHLWVSREALLANPMVEYRIILRELSSNYPATPKTYMMSDTNMWSNTPPSNNQFNTPPPTLTKVLTHPPTITTVKLTNHHHNP